MASPLPHNLQSCIDFFAKLPGIGPKSAKRLGFYLLRMPQGDLQQVAESLNGLKSTALYCKICCNLTESALCPICEDSQRDVSTILIVEDVLDLLSFESGTQYQGVYHVLHGRIDPLHYIGPDDIYLPQLLTRVRNEAETLKEIILATNPNTEGEATAMYIQKQLDEIRSQTCGTFTITRLAYGLPIGADLEYTDYMTLKRAIEGRREIG